jgi:antitoxin MazE
MEANIIKVGNSKGIIIPSNFLKLIGLGNKVSIEVENNKIIISSIEKIARDGWCEMFINDINMNGQPKRLMPDFFEDENSENWTW